MIPQTLRAPQQTPQAPGQAPMPGQTGNALPNMLAQQKGFTPPPQVDQLAKMPVDQLKQLFFQTMNMDTGLQPLTVLAAIRQSSENQRLQALVRGQAFRNQAAQQPGTIRDDVLQSSYAGGGIVALNKGGEVQRFQSGAGPRGLTTGFAPQYQAMREAGIDISPYDSPDVRADKIRRFEEYKRTGVLPPPTKEAPEFRAEGSSPEETMGASVVQKPPSPIRKLLTPSVSSLLNDIVGDRPNFYSEELYGKPRAAQVAAPAEIPERLKDTRQIAAAPSGGIAQQTAARQSAPDARQRATPGGIGTLAAPAMESVDEERRAARELLDRRIRQAEASKNVPPEVRAAQEGVSSLLTESAKAAETERGRMKDLAERRMQEARARSERPGYMDPEMLGEILAGMQGAKNLSAALTGGGAGAGKGAAKRNAALRAAEEKYDLQQGELFKLDNARRDIEMKKAERAQAIAVGDWDRATKAEQEIIAAQDVYNKASMDVKFKLGEFGLKTRELDLKGQELAQRAQQIKLAAEQLGDTRLANAISLAQTRVQQSRDGIKKIVEGALGPLAPMYQMDPEKFAKDKPELFNKVQGALKDYQDNVMKPADESLNRLVLQAESRSAGGQRVVSWNQIPGG